MKKKTLLSALAIGAIATVALTGCRGGGGGDAGAGGDDTSLEDAKPMTLVLGHAGAESDMRQTASLQFKELVEKESDGKITVEIHPASTLGTWEEMIEGLQLGTVDLVIESLLSLETYTDLASVETAPFLYDDYDQFSEVWDGDLGDEIKSAITEASGYEILGNMYRGPRELTTKTPVTNLPALQGLTIRTPSAATMLATWEALGARAEALPFNEVYSALESGVLDGQENPLDAIYFNSIHEVAPNITETSHMYANYHFLMWGAELAGMPKVYQEIIVDAADEVGKTYTETTLENIDVYKADLEAAGAVFHELEDRQKWVDATQKIIDGLPARVQEWVERIRG